MFVLFFLLFLCATQALCLAQTSPSSSSLKIKRDTVIITKGTLWSDGNAKADAVLINGTSPGPVLRYRAGDVVILKVINGMKDANTTIHFHGLSQTLTPSSDGTPMISQWPIAPGRFFEYEMHLTEEDVGTTYYHSHVGLQLSSATAPLIIEEAEKRYTYKSDKIMMLSDYYYERQASMEKKLRGRPFQWPGSANAALLNGAGWQAQDACNVNLARSANTSCSASTYAGPMIIDVDFATTYRFRWIGATTMMHYAVQINNHSQTIITVDGTFVEPLKVAYIELMAGQRYDTLFSSKTRDAVANDAVNGCYLIRMESRWRLPATNGWAMLRYPNGKCSTSTTQSNNTYIEAETFGWISNQFHPHKLFDKHAPAPDDAKVTRRMYLDVQMVGVQQGGVEEHVNGFAYQETKSVLHSGLYADTPYLIAVYKNETLAPSYDRAMSPPVGFQKGFDVKTEAFVARAGEVIDVVIINNASALFGTTDVHPWHFHSQDHWTMAMGVGDFTLDGFEKAKKAFSPPIARDTTGVWPGLGASVINPPIPLQQNSSGAWSVLRIRVPDDGSASGVWLLHCHWAFHQFIGMATRWAFVPAQGEPSVLRYQYRDPSYLDFGHNVTAPSSSSF